MVFLGIIPFEQKTRLNNQNSTQIHTHDIEMKHSSLGFVPPFI